MSDTIYVERELEIDVEACVDQLAWNLLKVTTLTGEVSHFTDVQRNKVIAQAQTEGLLKQVRSRVRELRQNVQRELLNV